MQTGWWNGPRARARLTGLLILTLSGAAFAPAAETKTKDSPGGEAGKPFPGGKQGDLWILAGQSNMTGLNKIIKTPATDPRLLMFNMDNRWMTAAPPEHRIYEAVAPIHRMMTGLTPEKFAAMGTASRKKPIGGVGPGFFFGLELVRALDRPVGLIPCAHGGASLDQWSPARRGEGGRSLYGAMMDRVAMIGHPVKGILWYQGESEAMLRNSGNYEQRFLEFVDAVRRDLGQPELPFLYVQIGAYAMADDGQGADWEKVREAQRRAAGQRKNLWVVSAIDLTRANRVHLDYEGQERLGRRLAEVALGEVYGLKDRATPIDLESVEFANAPDRYSYVRVRFSGVSGGLRAAGRPIGFELRPAAAGASPAPVIYKTEFDPADPAAVLLRVIADSPIKPGQFVLYYGAGIDPYVNIVDNRDMPVPAFGPVEVKDAALETP